MTRLASWFVVSAFLSAGCMTGGAEQVTFHASSMPSMSEVGQAEWLALSNRRVFFGHQSVGRDIFLGINRVLNANPHLPLRVVSSDAPNTISGPAIIESRIGVNRQPLTKAEAFEDALAGGFGHEPAAIAMYKYCYVDVQPTTDVDALFRDYAARMQRLHIEYPDLTVVHFTLPLHSAPEGAVERIRTLLGRSTQTALNAKRARYNALMRERYAEQGTLFDLALLQSTKPDGTLSFTMGRGEPVASLAPEWTSDGAHLNEVAQEAIAEKFLAFLAKLPGSENR